MLFKKTDPETNVTFEETRECWSEENCTLLAETQRPTPPKKTKKMTKKQT